MELCFCERKCVQLSTRSLRQMLCGSFVKTWNLADHMKKHQNAKAIDEKMKTKEYMNWKAFGASFLCWVVFLSKKPDSCSTNVLTLLLNYYLLQSKQKASDSKKL